jgi:hypothetical protein
MRNHAETSYTTKTRNVITGQGEDGTVVGSLENDEPDDGIGTSPAPRELDTWSSASRQHFIDTGEYLSVGEVIDEAREREDAAAAKLDEILSGRSVD